MEKFPNVEGGKIYEHKWVRDGVSPFSSIYIDFHKDRDKIVAFDQPGICQQKATTLPVSYVVRFKACVIDKGTEKMRLKSNQMVGCDGHASPAALGFR